MATILLVEDDRFLSDTVKAYLEWKEHVVDRAFDGAEALEKMRFGCYDLVILDWQLPCMDGVEVCREYRGGGGGVPVLMFTGRSDPKEIDSAREAGASAFLPKPFKLDQLERNVEELMRGPVAG